MTLDELKDAHSSGAWIYGIEPDGKLHRIENPGWSCPPDRYIALVPYELYIDAVGRAADAEWAMRSGASA